MVNYTDGTITYSTNKSPDLNVKSLEILPKLFKNNDIEPKTDWSHVFTTRSILVIAAIDENIISFHRKQELLNILIIFSFNVK